VHRVRLAACLHCSTMALVLLLGVVVRATDCSDAGFTESLACSKCDLFTSFVQDQALAELCGSCCKNDTAVGTVYKKAKLEICK
jgi:hypothetical protein